MNKEIIIIAVLFIFGNILAWFQSNSQFLWQWWYDRPIFTILIYSIPTAFTFFYGWRFAVEAFDGSLWSARMFGFGVATIVFAAMSYLMKGEGITAKTALCLALSCLIICIQVFWKDY
tara:strand:- start:458 stop:811 length:354 start_codon:yes stop_codon:yes gene_type:complete